MSSATDEHTAATGNRAASLSAIRQEFARGSHPNQGTALFPHVETRRMRLRPASAAEGTENYEIFLRNGMNNLPNLDMWLAAYSRDFAAHSIYLRDLAAHFIIQQLRDNADVGFAGLAELSPAGHCELGLYTDLRKADIGIGAEATLLLLNYAFATWRVRKVYMRTTDAAIGFFGGTLATMCRREAVLKEHQYFRGRLWDIYLYAVHRTDWDERGAQIVERLVAGPRTVTAMGGPGRGASGRKQAGE